MALPFLTGLFSSIKKNAKGSVKEALKRQTGDLEKLSLKKEQCAASVRELEEEKEKCLSCLGGVVDRVRALENKPRFDELSISGVELIPFDEKAMKAASQDPAAYIAENSSSECWELISETPLLDPGDAEIAWDAMLENERKINSWFLYYVSLQILAEKYSTSLSKLRGLLETHISVLDQFKQKNGKTNWNDFSDAQKMAFRNAVLLSKLIMEMCSVSVISSASEESLDKLNADRCTEMINKAAEFCSERGFEYDGTTYDVVLRGSAREYFSYCYRLEKRLPDILPISSEQVAPILEVLRKDSDVTISREVTHLHARNLMDTLRDIDIKTQRMVSPDGSSVFYIDLI